MATANNNIYTDNSRINTDNSTIDGENVACVFTEKPTCTDADKKSQSVLTTNISNSRNFNYTQGSYYALTKFQANGTNTTTDYEYSRLFAKILDVVLVNRNLDLLSDDQLKLITKFNSASHNTFNMPLDARRLDQFLSEFREYSITDKKPTVIDFPVITSPSDSTSNNSANTSSNSNNTSGTYTNVFIDSSNSNMGSLANYAASNIVVAPNQSHPVFITDSDPSWYMVYSLKVTPSNTQAYYTISIYNGDASQSSILNNKSNLFYLSANNLGEFTDSIPFTINGTSNIKSIVINNNSSVSNTFNITLVATRYAVPTTTTVIV